MDPNTQSLQLIAAAAQAHAQGNLKAAEELANQALLQTPDDLQAKLLLGVICVKTGRPQQGFPFLDQVAREDRGSFFARHWLSVLFRQQGRLDEAAAVGLEALRLKPDDVPTLIIVGSCLLDLRRFNDAGPVFTRAVRLSGQNAGAHEGLALALLGIGKEAEAIHELRSAVKLDPTSESIGLRLGAVLLESQDFKGAESCARTVLQNHPGSSKAHALLARSLMDQGGGQAALENSTAALALTPADASTLVVHGSILQNLGRIDEAESFFHKAIELEPKQCHAYFALVHNRKMTESDEPLVRAMAELEQDPSIPESNQIHLQYGLGKANHDLGKFGSAMEHYDKANRLAHSQRFRSQPYNRQAHEAGFEFVRNTLTRRFLEENQSSNDSDLPIFVVGMMRSGTTLVEQILSSHSEIGAAGEQRFWPEHHSAILKPGSRFNKAEAERLGREYVNRLRETNEKGKFLIDKMPVNYSFLGVIFAALPNAKFIHIQRHPVDTCLSIYFTPNRSRIEWAHDKSNIAFAYRQYQKLMDHWCQSLPPDRLLNVQYQELVLNREETTRKMLQFCGLEWQDACLYPEDNNRSVLTPSVWQVRQPVYTSSLNRWQKYEPWLGPLRELL